ncbi:T-lymphocyte surface antigen Ly-9 isoform X1 [Moschus berezovskii]|uniref:T-lymphocyte surface antigen Ly-9 isoform X1 n=1 Tax=Moschus berezovskii TaxID=68408 RepID=UPI002443F4C7|nr:T-lymphocyte surface antigen Ly-9 isoform X1 [Moschus berezovskii]
MARPRRHTDDWALQPSSNKPPKNQPHIFSPYLWTPLLFLLMGQGASEKDSASTVVKGILGGSVILSLNLSVDAEIEHIAWSGPNDVFALAFPGGKILFIDKSYQGRINITENNSLSINKLTMKDAGSYKARINRKDSEDINEKFILYIYEQLQEPQVTIHSVNVSENASCTITLVCSVEGPGEDVQYKWTSRDPRASESWGHPTLTISWLPCDTDLPYTCTAKNPVSQSSSHPVHVAQFCTDLGSSRGGPMGETVLGVLGESITLSLALLDSQHIDNVVWMFNTSIISKEWREEATANQLIEFKDPDQNTVWVSSQDYSLKIVQLKMEHAGIYHAYMCSNARVASVKHINLHIYQRLKKPKVTRSLWLTKDGICKVNLTCSVEDSGHNVTYGWTPLPKGAVISQGGAHLSISWISGEKHPNFTCTASNPVSNNSRQFLSRDLCPGPERSTEFWIGRSLVILFVLLGFGISGWCLWKQQRRCSTPAFSSSQAETSVDTPGYEKLDTFPKTARHASDSSSDSNGTTGEDEERTGMHRPVNGRDRVCDSVTQEDAELDSDSEGQAEYDLITPDNMAPALVVEGETVYAQVFLNLQGKTPVPQKKENSATVYCSIQKPQKVVPPPQQNDLGSPEIPTYENAP